MLARTSQIAFALALAVATAGAATALASDGHDVKASTTCSDYSNQRQAQLRKDTRDADGDGIYCESLPCPCLKPDSGGGGGGGGERKPSSGCTRPHETVTVELSRSRYPESTLHFEVAWKQGVPRRYTIARNRADRNRAAWNPYVEPGKDADGNGKDDDRDEVPMAFTKEGGRKAPNGRSASHIAYVDSSDNQGAGSSIGGRLRRYCNGTHFRVKPTGRRSRPAVIVVAFRNGKQVSQVVRRR